MPGHNSADSHCGAIPRLFYTLFAPGRPVGYAPLPVNLAMPVAGGWLSNEGVRHGPCSSMSPPSFLAFIASYSSIVVGNLFILMSLPNGHLIWHSAEPVFTTRVTCTGCFYSCLCFGVGPCTALCHALSKVAHGVFHALRQARANQVRSCML